MDRDVHNLKLFIKSDSTPTNGKVPGWVCARLSKIFCRVRNKFNKKRAISNLLPFQQRLMDQLINDNNLLFPDTDKGLGPCAVTYNQYVQDVLRHLSNGDVYQRLTENEATQLANDLRSEIENDHNDAVKKINEFLHQLLARGHTRHSLTPLFIRAEANAAAYMARTPEEHGAILREKKSEGEKQLYFHLQYHPNDPKAHDIQELWTEYVSHPPGELPSAQMNDCWGYTCELDKLVVV
ncbi:hypothetical protein ACHAWO_006104 [Cyclotella atomus]|uniref:Uncharacterized protein n=1 Tax=Cyclotella atomus TaxID=382360 RepID=A0ABD3NDM2_9STRA